MKVVFRADASSGIGSGHVMRCLALAEALRHKGHETFFLCRRLPGDMVGFIKSKGVAVDILDATDNPADAKQSAHMLEATGGTDWLVVDHYGLDANWESLLRACCGKIMVIDDVADRRHDCDLLLDQNLRDGNTYSELVPASAEVLIGPKFALLRDEFSQARANVKVRTGEVRRIVVFYGGSDPTGETTKAVEALRRLNLLDIKVDVIVGESNPRKDQVAELCAALPSMRFYCQVPDMAYLLARADLALGAAGVSSWERLALGVPALVIAVADNQLENMRQLDRLGVAVGLGVSRDVSVDSLSQAIGKLLSSPWSVHTMSEKALGLVDGEGTSRVAARMAEMMA